jgi:hypothetical protein
MINYDPYVIQEKALMEFPIECSLFVNQKALYSISGMTKYYIKSAFATMLGTRSGASYKGQVGNQFKLHRKGQTKATGQIHPTLVATSSID